MRRELRRGERRENEKGAKGVDGENALVGPTPP